MEAESSIQCPRCGSDAWYHFGKTASGKKRYICQVCGRQFIVDYSYKSLLKDRPQCPVCGAAMHVYMRGGKSIRFRCSCYPNCKCFLKSGIESLDVVHARDWPTSSNLRSRLVRKEVVVP